MDQPFVELKIEKNIGEITFFHPRHNAIPSDLLKQLEASIYEASNDETVKMILIKSAGNRTFCAGADFEELISITSFKVGKAFFNGFGKVINAIRKIDKLVVCRVQGKAVGGGVGLAAACDIAFATRYGSIRLSEISIGIGPFVIAPAVERKIGKNAFALLTLQPMKWMSAQEANENGLYAGVYDDAEAMDEAIDHYLKEMSQYNPEALKEMKRVLWKGTEHWDDLLEDRAALSGRLVLSEFTKQALNKFKHT